uniref:Uncharacterized protein n=1 Tax=Quercus lobata TaxID=97700 RepID=A0A7N2MNT7_QUELO
MKMSNNTYTVPESYPMNGGDVINRYTKNSNFQITTVPSFPGKHLPCRNVSGMGCEEYYDCPAWDLVGHRKVGSGSYGSGPPECCASAFEAIKSINLTKLECEGYSSAYSLAPLKMDGPNGWSYGVRVKYSVQKNDDFCHACEATGGTCGHGSDGIRQNVHVWELQFHIKL